jgi:hypothetical protein
MAFEGRLATVGYVDHQLKAEIDLQALHAKRLTLFGVSNKLRNAEQRAAGVPAFKADLWPAIADGRIQPLVDRVFAFDELPAAQAHMQANQHLGKIVLKISMKGPPAPHRRTATRSHAGPRSMFGIGDSPVSRAHAHGWADRVQPEPLPHAPVRSGSRTGRRPAPRDRSRAGP